MHLTIDLHNLWNFSTSDDLQYTICACAYVHYVYTKKLPCKDIYKPVEICIVPHNANFWQGKYWWIGNEKNCDEQNIDKSVAGAILAIASRYIWKIIDLNFVNVFLLKICTIQYVNLEKWVFGDCLSVSHTFYDSIFSSYVTEFIDQTEY